MIMFALRKHFQNPEGGGGEDVFVFGVFWILDVLGFCLVCTPCFSQYWIVQEKQVRKIFVQATRNILSTTMLHSFGKKLGDCIIVGIVRTLYYNLNNVAFKLGRGLEIEEIISTIEIYYFSFQKKTSLKIFLLLIIFPPHLFMSVQDIFSICSLPKALRKN